MSRQHGNGIPPLLDIWTCCLLTYLCALGRSSAPPNPMKRILVQNNAQTLAPLLKMMFTEFQPAEREALKHPWRRNASELKLQNKTKNGDHTAWHYTLYKTSTLPWLVGECAPSLAIRLSFSLSALFCFLVLQIIHCFPCSIHCTFILAFCSVSWKRLRFVEAVVSYRFPIEGGPWPSLTKGLQTISGRCML